MANTLIAYPFTKSQRDRDKIMSEVMIASLIRALSPVPSFILSTVGDTLDEVILDGYYFKLDPLTTAATSANTLYFYTSKETQDLGSSFPELYENASGECLFTSSQSGMSAYDKHQITIRSGGSLVLKTKDTLFQSNPYFIAPESDQQTKQANVQKIWIKQETFNPYVYTGTGAYNDDNWTPLGAVYKSTT